MTGPLDLLVALGVVAGATSAAPDPSALQRDLEQARLRADSDDELEELATALERLHEHAPTVAGDRALQEARMVGYLTLARGYLARDDVAAAGVVVDEAIRVARGQEIPSATYGPSLHAFVQGRYESRPAGRSTLEVVCNVPCQIYLDETRTDSRTANLVPGTYRLWVTSEGGPRLRRAVDVESSPSVETIHYEGYPAATPVPATAEPAAREDLEPPTRGPSAADERLRVAPRWAELVGLGVGVALTVTGSVLASLGPTCVPLDGDPCSAKRRYDTAGIPLIAVGAALTVAGGVTLAVDEVRMSRAAQGGGRTPHTVRVGWALRF